VRGSPVKTEIQQPPVRRAEDDLTDRRALVIDEPRFGDEPRVVEGVGAAKGNLLLCSEEQLDARMRSSLVENALRGLEHHDHGGLVVRAEDRPRCVADDPVLAGNGLDGSLRRNRVRVRAEEDRRPASVGGRDPAVHVPGVTVEPRRGVVLVPFEP
jgi:hypothetical protein